MHECRSPQSGGPTAAAWGPETPSSLWQQLGNWTLPTSLHHVKAMWKIQLLFKVSSEKPVPLNVIILSGTIGCWNMLKCVGGGLAQRSPLLLSRAGIRTLHPKPFWCTISLVFWVSLPCTLPALQHWRWGHTAALPSPRLFIWVSFLLCSHLMPLRVLPPFLSNLTGKEANRFKNFWEGCGIDRHKHCCYRSVVSFGSQAKNKVSILFHSIVCILKACRYRVVCCLAGSWASSNWMFMSVTQCVWR